MIAYRAKSGARVVLLCTLALIFCAPTSAQSLAERIDAPYALLDLAETQTGVLANRRALLLDPGRFQGTAATDTLRPMQWEILFGQFRESAAEPTGTRRPDARP